MQNPAIMPLLSDIHLRYHTRWIWRSPNSSYSLPSIKISDLHIGPNSNSVILQDESGGHRIHRIRFPQFKISDLHIGPTTTSAIQDEFGGRRIHRICFSPFASRSDLYLRDHTRRIWRSPNSLYSLPPISNQTSISVRPPLLRSYKTNSEVTKFIVFASLHFKSDFHIDPTSTSTIIQDEFGGHRIHRIRFPPFQVRLPYRSDLHLRDHTRRIGRSPNSSYSLPSI